MKIKIEKIIYPGKSIGLSENKTILTNEGLPGETAEVSAVKEKKNFIEAKTIKIITPSVSRITPRCSHYQTCGAYQYMNYKTQLAVKESQLKEMFPNTLINATPSPEIWGYRNKIKLTVIWKNRAAGLAYHVPESRDKFIQIESCCLVSENVNKFLASFTEIVNKENLTFIKEIEVRESYSTKELMLIIRPLGKPEDKLHALFSKFNVKNTYIEETVLGKTFRIGPDSFFQINVPMLEAVLKEMQKSTSLDKKEMEPTWAQIRNSLGGIHSPEPVEGLSPALVSVAGECIIADLYCGIGTFGICLSQYVKEVIGIESAPGNISFLKSNLKLNKIKNFRLYEGSCEKLFPSLMNSGIDALILDPPRKGIDNMLCQNILLSSIKKIMYLSCNPSTLSRDLKILGRRYQVKILHMFDFFPQTPHIETLAILEKKHSNCVIM